MIRLELKLFFLKHLKLQTHAHVRTHIINLCADAEKGYIDKGSHFFNLSVPILVKQTQLTMSTRPIFSVERLKMSKVLYN